MPLIQLFHNPGAGDQSHQKEHLVKLIESEGYECQYVSVKSDDWKEFDTEGVDLMMIAGGDGTVRKVVKQLLKKKHRLHTIPLVLLPMGTANNISRTLELGKDPEHIISSLHDAPVVSFSVGLLENVSDESFFMESFGFGLFPYLMMEMKKKEDREDPEEQIRLGLETLLELTARYSPRTCHIEVDGVKHSGNYILAEVMNIKSIGPNLFIAPMADPTDEVFEIALVSEADAPKFADYIRNRLEGIEATFEFIALKGKEIRISWEGTHVHVDDKVVKLKKGEEVSIRLEPGALRFRVPPDPEKKIF